MKTQEISVQLEASPGILIYKDWRLQKRKLDSNLYYVRDGEKISYESLICGWFDNQ